MAWKRKMLFWMAYLTGKAPWDTGVTPPEVIRLVQSGELTPGCAVDLGCGTGLNAIFLIRHGWQVVGVDSEPIAIRRAKRQWPHVGMRSSISRPWREHDRMMRPKLRTRKSPSLTSQVRIGLFLLPNFWE